MKKKIRKNMMTGMTKVINIGPNDDGEINNNSDDDEHDERFLAGP